jgi:hypothetical protein
MFDENKGGGQFVHLSQVASARIVSECEVSIGLDHWKLSEMQLRYALYASPTSICLPPTLPPEFRYVTGDQGQHDWRGVNTYGNTIEIGADTRSEQPSGSNGQTAAKINHASNCSAMENCKTVLYKSVFEQNANIVRR